MGRVASGRRHQARQRLGVVGGAGRQSSDRWCTTSTTTSTSAESVTGGFGSGDYWWLGGWCGYGVRSSWRSRSRLGSGRGHDSCAGYAVLIVWVNTTVAVCVVLGCGCSAVVREVVAGVGRW